MNFNRFKLYLAVIVLLPVLFLSCEIEEPSAPSWDIDANLPFTNKRYNIFDIIKRNSNVGFDSLNNDLVFIYGESNYKRTFGEDIRFDGLAKTDVIAPSTLMLDTFIVVDDSTFVTKTEFLNGNLTFEFFNSFGKDYSVNFTIKNLFSLSTNDTVTLFRNIPAGKPITVELNLAEYYVKNDIPDNRFKLSLTFQSPNPVPVNFSYTLSSYSIKIMEGRLKPISTGITNDEVIDPFGSDVPEGEMNFAGITPGKNFLIVKKYSGVYQVDFTSLSIIGVNKNGHRVRLKYLRNGNEGDPVDSVFKLTLPAALDSLAYPINENNSNILEFINNVPKRILVTRNDFLNLSYEEGSVRYTDSLSLKLAIQVPLDVSISEPIVFRDTVGVGIDDEDQRKNLDDAKGLIFTFNTVNGFPLRATAKVLLLDSFFTPLIAITRIVGNLPDSSMTANAAPVGINGFVSGENITSFESELDSNLIQKIKHVGKVIYEYKLYTDPNQIPPPMTTVKIRGSDVVRAISFGTVKYRIKFD